jgi:hypothetical protein
MKPIVRFKKAYTQPIVGRSCLLELAEDHHSPSVKTRQVTTSKVVAVRETGGFETLNTNYVPE